MIAVTSSNPFNFQDLLTDPGSGGEIELEATLTLPTEADEGVAVPAVIFVHGASGPLPRHQQWLDLIHEMGIATVVADHLAPRGEISVIGDHTNVTGAAMTADVLHLLRAAVAHPGIDPGRIAIMGSSKGGGVAIYSAWSPLRKTISPEQAFAAHIALYPPCIYWEDKDFTRSPILLLIGEEDNWTGVRHCVESADELRAAGLHNVEVRLFPHAHHAFDGSTAVQRLGSAYGLSDCRILIGADGMEYASDIAMDSAQNKRRALGACAGRGATIGGNPKALELAKEALRDLLAKTLLQ